MTVLLVIFMLLAFLGMDYVIRETSRRQRLKRERKEREAILTSAVRIEFADDIKSLKRVEVPHPRARILAVDDEAVVLDSFRRILVLEGFNIDTVETGPEALTLVRSNDYDFVFTDLKMPGMDGVEVVKAVKHLRPDVDMVVITGYGSIETAVETLQHGACEYVQKPFSVDELAEFDSKLLIKRTARQEALRQPTVRIVSPTQAEGAPANEFCVPGGAFLSQGHTWARIEPDGQVRVGIDDFANKAIGNIGQVLLPRPGQEVQAGEALFSLKRGEELLTFTAPVAGQVTDINPLLTLEPGKLNQSPYKEGWVCRLQASELKLDLDHLLIGKPVVAWYGVEITRLRTARAEAPATGPELWASLQPFFKG